MTKTQTKRINVKNPTFTKPSKIGMNRLKSVSIVLHRLALLTLGVQEVGSSNLPAPTINKVFYEISIFKKLELIKILLSENIVYFS